MRKKHYSRSENNNSKESVPVFIKDYHAIHILHLNVKLCIAHNKGFFVRLVIILTKGGAGMKKLCLVSVTSLFILSITTLCKAEDKKDNSFLYVKSGDKPPMHVIHDEDL